jgi:hypothetical protein
VNLIDWWRCNNHQNRSNVEQKLWETQWWILFNKVGRQSIPNSLGHVHSIERGVNKSNVVSLDMVLMGRKTDVLYSKIAVSTKP